MLLECLTFNPKNRITIDELCEVVKAWIPEVSKTNKTKKNMKTFAKDSSDEQNIDEDEDEVKSVKRYEILNHFIKIYKTKHKEKQR